jgi:hypothetical protein
MATLLSGIERSVSSTMGWGMLAAPSVVWAFTLPSPAISPPMTDG